jgi:hypothetical protein
MQRILVVAVLAVALSAVAFSQTNSRRITLSKSELELIALSREFVDTSIGKEMIVLTDGVTLTPSGPMGTAEVKGKWESVELEDLDALVDGERAVVTGRVMFKGHSPEGKAIDASSRVKIVYARREGRWEFSSGCLGDCGDK